MSGAEIELMKRQVEAQLSDYETAVRGYAAFMDDWRARNDPSAKRLQRFRAAAAKRENAA